MPPNRHILWPYSTPFRVLGPSSHSISQLLGPSSPQTPIFYGRFSPHKQLPGHSAPKPTAFRAVFLLALNLPPRPKVQKAPQNGDFPPKMRSACRDRSQLQPHGAQQMGSSQLTFPCLFWGKKTLFSQLWRWSRQGMLPGAHFPSFQPHLGFVCTKPAITPHTPRRGDLPRNLVKSWEKKKPKQTKQIPWVESSPPSQIGVKTTQKR